MIFGGRAAPGCPAHSRKRQGVQPEYRARRLAAVAPAPSIRYIESASTPEGARAPACPCGADYIPSSFPKAQSLFEEA